MRGKKPEVRYGTVISGVDRWYVAGAHVSPAYECPHASDVLTEDDGNPCRILPLVYVIEGDLSKLACVSCELNVRGEMIENLREEVRQRIHRVSDPIPFEDRGVSFP